MTQTRLARPPLYVRALNTAAAPLARGMRLRSLSLEPDDLIEAARARTGLEDFGEGELHEPLARLARSTEDEARLTVTGRIAVRTYLVDLLANRLRMQRDRETDPAIASGGVERPVFILGLPRTGTTLLHNLIAQDASVRVPFTWEVMHPSPPPMPGAVRDHRIARTARALRWVDRLAPDFKRIHPYDALLPQECIAITTHAFASIQFHTTQHVPAYQDWLERTRPVEAYRCHRRFLQHLQRHDGGRRWVLKAPGHLFALDALLAVYPDACIVQTHRDPLRVVASIASHALVLRSAFSDDVDANAVARDWSMRWAGALAHGLRVRDADARATGRWLDLHYAEVLRDPVAAVAKVYAHAGLELRPAARAAMETFLAANPQSRHGTHRYTLGQFGLDRDEERARFASYCARFGIAEEGGGGG
jgi:hypothetical protein